MRVKLLVRWLPLFVALTLVITSPASAQLSADDQQFIEEILQTATSADEETAREVHGKCVAYQDRVSRMTDISSRQRHYFEAEINFCISYSMHRGNFSDATGDQCSYNYAFATKFARLILDGRGQPGFTAELMMSLGERLQSAAHMGPQLGCRSDYSIFQQAVAVAKEEAAKPPPESPYKLWDDLSSAAMSITSENAREIHKECLALSAQIGAKPELQAAERLFYEGLVEDCVARAMIIGKYSDESGDACAHHFRFAQKYAEGAAAAKGDSRLEERIAPVMRGELEVAKRQGPGMGCKQDYGALKAD